MSLKGPDYFDWDIALSRTFTFKEKQSVQVRADFFNLTNHPNFMTPIATMNSGSFGQILSANDPRILQFAAKTFFDDPTPFERMIDSYFKGVTSRKPLPKQRRSNLQGIGWIAILPSFSGRNRWRPAPKVITTGGPRASVSS
jgi:hypothetical protein